MKKMHIGIIIAILLIAYWYMKDHPNAAPVKQGAVEIVTPLAA